MKRARTVCFVTGNANKLRELKSKLSSLGAEVDLTSQNVDLPELQGTAEEIATKKAQQAAELVGAAVLVEDTCLQFHALKGLPVRARLLGARDTHKPHPGTVRQVVSRRGGA
jgi:inosine triphosphate pyrophosphatase